MAEWARDRDSGPLCNNPLLLSQVLESPGLDFVQGLLARHGVVGREDVEQLATHIEGLKEELVFNRSITFAYETIARTAGEYAVYLRPRLSNDLKTETLLSARRILEAVNTAGTLRPQTGYWPCG